VREISSYRTQSIASKMTTNLITKQDGFQIQPLLVSRLRGGSSNPQRRPEVNENLSSVRITIVDDDEALREALGSMLKASGFRVGKFSSAEEYLASPDRQSASCLILDVRLPGMSGIELQHLLRRMGDEIPIVFLTAHGGSVIRDVVMKAGALGFLTKPVRRDVLLERVWSAVAMAT
jgi:FixJ family two-component response regulator